MNYKTEAMSNYVNADNGAKPESLKAKFLVNNIPYDTTVDRNKTMQTVAMVKDNQMLNNQ